MKPTRAYGLDNLKFLLIFCVVLGHVLEGAGLDGSPEGLSGLYRVIYSFHMPAFLFLSGWFARFRLSKILCQLLYPYLLFQVLYSLFDHCILTGNPIATFQFQASTPYWILWYLLALAVYHLLTPLLDLPGKVGRLIITAVCIGLSIVSGFNTEIGYYLSIGRIFTFLPFFTAGFYLGKAKKPLPRVKWPVRILLTAGVTGCAIYIYRCAIPFVNFYGVRSYASIQSGPKEKLMLLAIACLWLLFLLLVVNPLVDRPIPLISTLGANTLSIYLLHGFCVRYLRTFSFFLGRSLPECMIISLVLLVLLGNSITARFFRAVFTGQWLEKLWDDLRAKLHH